MEKVLRDGWIEEYGDYEANKAIKFVARRLRMKVQHIEAVLNARNEFYGALGIETPAEIHGSPTRKALLKKCGKLISIEDREMALLIFPNLCEYIERATKLSSVKILFIMILDAEYTYRCTGFSRLNDLIKWCVGELREALGIVAEQDAKILDATEH